MLPKLFLLTFSLLYVLIVDAQKKDNYNIELGTGIGIAQWKVDRGLWARSVSSAKIIDKSKKSMAVPFNLTLLRASGRFYFGIDAKYHLVYMDEIIGFGHNGDIDRVAQDNSIDIFRLFVTIRYDLINRSNYQFTPSISFGTYYDNSIHPEKQYFGTRLGYEFSFINKWRTDKGYIFLKPLFSILRTESSPNDRQGGIHRIIGTDLLVGLGFNL